MAQRSGALRGPAVDACDRPVPDSGRTGGSTAGLTSGMPSPLRWAGSPRIADGRIYHIREYYGCTGTPNAGVRMQSGGDRGGRSGEIEEEDPNAAGQADYRHCGPVAFLTRAVGRVVARHDGARRRTSSTGGRRTTRAWRARCSCITGWPSTGRDCPCSRCSPRAETASAPCRRWCTTRSRPEDIDTQGEDHIYDMIRYVLMERPIAASTPGAGGAAPGGPPGPLQGRAVFTNLTHKEA